MKSLSKQNADNCLIDCVGSEAVLRVTITGKLDAAVADDSISELQNLLEKFPQKKVDFDLEHLLSIDDYGVAVLSGMRRMLLEQHRDFNILNANKDVQGALSFYHYDTLAKTLRAPGSNIIVRLGDAVIKQVKDFTFMTIFLGSTLLSLIRVCKHPRILRWPDALHYMERTGVDALPIVGLISFLLGLIMAFMSSVQLQQFGANIYVASLVSLSMTRELGPIMTAIIVAGRSGSSFAAEIGSMKISEEIDALVTMGLDPYIFLVLPKIIAALLVVPLLTLFSDLFAIIGGLIVGIGMLDLTVSGYITQTVTTLTLFDVFWGVFKSVIFAYLISWTGCLRGFQVKGGAAGVGKATTSAVVTSIFLIILTDSLFAVILRYWE